MRKHALLLPALLLLATLTLCGVAVVSEYDRLYRELFARETRFLTPPLPASASFAGEPAPLDTFYVREAFERELISNTFMHSNTMLVFKRAARWFPVIEPILKKNGIPDDFKYLAVAESNLLHAVSPAGAEGFWQFIKPTGQRYGLEINEQVDERYHLEKSTQAACDYFREAKEKFGNWTLAAASYNRGLDGLRRAVENQKVTSYYDLYLNDETARYLYRIMAIREIWLHPVRYGYYLRKSDFHSPVDVRTITVDTAIADLPAFARTMGITYKALREFNPWIRNYSLPNKTGKRYTLRIPDAASLRVKDLREETDKDERFFHDTLKISDLK